MTWSTAFVLRQVLSSYLQVYENRVHDLLDVSNRGKPVEEWATVSLRSDGKGSQVLRGLTTFEVDNEGKRVCLYYENERGAGLQES